jgi:hypothetical protein
VSEAALYLAVAALCCALGALIAAGAVQNPIAVGATAAALLAAALRWPALALVGVLALATLSGRSGAHWFVPELNIPVFETLLGLGAAAALLHLLRSRSLSAAPGTVVLMLWIPSAVWGLALFLLANERDLISGLREAALFVYPLLVALPLAATRAPSLRRLVEERGWILIALLAFAVTALGAWNLAKGNTIDLLNGQVRSLGAEYSPVLAGGVFVGLWLLEARRHRPAAIVLLFISLVGMVFVNHRSAYVALILAAMLFVLVHPRGSRDPHSRRLASALFITVMVGGLLLVTPLGQAGLDRFMAIFETDDPTVQFRFGAISAAVEKEDAWQALLGSGVGLQATDLSGGFDPLTVSRIEPHNSYISMYQRGGIVGAVLMIAPLIYCFREMVRQRAHPEIRVLLSIAIFTLVMAGFNVVLENLYFGLWCWLPVLAGTVLAVQRRAAPI